MIKDVCIQQQLDDMTNLMSKFRHQTKCFSEASRGKVDYLTQEGAIIIKKLERVVQKEENDKPTI
jgi:hypothetical protein